jgi:hypothetical protein
VGRPKAPVERPEAALGPGMEKAIRLAAQIDVARLLQPLFAIGKNRE